MADKIRGITIEIGGDTSALSKALKGVNSDISDTQKQLKDVERLLKLDPTNTELLEQKQRLLNDSVDEYRKKLKTLQDEQDRFAEAAKNGDEKAQASYDALQREIISTSEYLKDAEKNANGFDVQLAKAGATAKEVADKAQLVADKTKALSAVGASVVAGLTGIAVKAMTASDDLNTLAQQSGFTTAELQKFQYASDIVDVSSETIISSVKKLRKNMDSNSSEVQEAWQRLGVQVVTTNGEMRDSTEVFYEVLEALSRVRNETERDQLAMQLFGKSADQLAGIIDDGGKRLRELGDEAERNGLIWTQESIDASNAVNDLVDKLKADVNQTILITGANALQALKPIIEDVIESISNLLKWIGNLDEEQLKLILTVATVVASISPVARIIYEISLATQGLILILPKLKTFLTSFNPQMAVLLGVLTALAVLIPEIKKTWDDMSGFEKVVTVLGSVTAAALGAAIAMGAFQSAASMGIAAAGIVAGIGAVVLAIESAKLRSSEIKMLAGGGNVYDGETAIVGEVAPEILTVRNGVAQVQPLTNNYHNNTYNNYSSPMEAVVNLDGNNIAKAVFNPLKRMDRLAGGSCIK